MHVTSQKSSNPGFTLIEVLVISPIVLIVVAIFVAVIVSLTGKSLEISAANKIIYDSEAAFEQLKEDVRYGRAFLSTNSTPVSSPFGADDGNSNFEASPNTLIIENYATSYATDVISRKFTYLKDQPNPCSSIDHIQNKIMTYNIVYFIRDNTLWRRILMPENYKTSSCDTPSQRPTCSFSKIGSECKAHDQRVIDDVSSLTINYYTSHVSSTPIPPGVLAQPGALNAARVIKVKLLVEKTVAGRALEYETSHNIELLNN